MNAFLRTRTAFGFEYLISFVAEHSDMLDIAVFLVTSPFDINVPTRGLLAVETTSSFVFMVGTFE